MRHGLVRELHDLLIKGTAAISVQAMGHRLDRDPAQLRATLDTIAAVAREMSENLRMLEQVSGRGDTTAYADHNPQRLTVGGPLVDVVRQTEAVLSSKGFVVTTLMSSGLKPEELDPLRRNTLHTALDVATMVIARHGVPGEPCTIRVATSSTALSLTVSAAVVQSMDPKDAAFVNALTERVELMSGSMWVGLADSHSDSVLKQWSLRLRLRVR